MNLFKRNKSQNPTENQSSLAELVLKNIHDGVIITDKAGVIQSMNPAAAAMTDSGNATGLDYGLVVRLESKEGRELSEAENPLIQAMKLGQPLDAFQGCLIVGQTAKRIPISVSVIPVDGLQQNRIITFRDITKELEEEGEQTEFISTASHEMRTPVATIDGYLSLCLNPQTATIDERARGYLTAAQNASKHLGKLFQDLLDVTKLDDGKIKPHFEPVEMVELIKSITDDYAIRAKEAKLTFNYGSDEPVTLGSSRRMEQVVYGFVDTSFMQEILDNLLDNAFKYTPSGGSIYVNVRGDGDRVLINVTDTGIGISADDLGHIFQKFYRADNSDTRTIGGTGLGLYLVKQRVEAMGGRVWAESAFGEGSTFYVSLPRITSDEYEKRMIAVRNQQMQEQLMRTGQVQPSALTSTGSQVLTSAPTPAPAPAPAPIQPSVSAPAPAPAPIQPSVSAPVQAPAPAPIQSQSQSAPPVTQPPTASPPSEPVSPTQPPKEINININGESK